MRLRRLIAMGIPELVGRGGQALSKRLDRISIARAQLRSPEAIFERLAVDTGLLGIRTRARAGHAGAAAAMLQQHFREAAPARFFAGATHEDLLALFSTSLDDARKELIATANGLRGGQFDLLGYRGLSFGSPVDWHLDPVSGHRSPRVHWSRLDPLDATAVGDSKVVWELNRHQWLIHLGQAYRVTGDETYAQLLIASLREWLQANPSDVGLNWTSSLEVSLRLMSWCWALVLLGDSASLSPEFFVAVLAALWSHAAHVERYLSYYFSPNTHLTGEALGLVYAGILFPQFQAAGRWRALGAHILERESARQILADGVYFEQSTCYQRYTVEIYLHFLILASRNGLPVAAVVAERVERMLHCLLALRSPDGSVPQIGDSDGGWLAPFAQRDPQDLRGIFAVAAAYFQRSDYAWAAGGMAPEAAWLLGPEACRRLEALRTQPPTSAPSRAFESGGYVVMRSGWDAEAHQLIFDVGPLGCPISGGHGHADLLSIQCSVFGTPCLVDPGTYCYTADAAWREHFRSTQAHSAVVLDGESQAMGAGPFGWGRRPAARLRRWNSSNARDFADAEHDAYCRLADPVVHRRRVLFVKPSYWVVIDDLVGRAEHRVELRFQFAPMEVSLEPDLWARARVAGARGLLVRPFAMVEFKGDVLEGMLDPIAGWIAPTYGRRIAAPLLVYTAEASLPLRVATVLLPRDDVAAPPPLIAAEIDGPEGPVALTFDGGRETVHFD